MRRIICIGNRYVAADSAGAAVHDCLRARPLPAGVELIDGGLGGLDLLQFLEGARRVVLVDSVSGFGRPGELAVLTADEVASAGGGAYDHAAGPGYLLSVLPAVCAPPFPEVTLVGIEGAPGAAVVERAAALALRLVLDASNPSEVKGRDDASECRFH